MKKIILISLLLIGYSCKAQEKDKKEIEKIKLNKMENKHEYNELITKDFEKFDYEKFNKDNPNSLGKTYKLSNGNTVGESGGVKFGWFLKSETVSNTFYTIYKGFYLTGSIKDKRINLVNGCIIGIGYEYDKSGKLIKETNYDQPYKIRVEDIIQFLKKNKAELNSNTTSVNRTYNELTKVGTWKLKYRGKYKEKDGIYLVTIDDQSNEIEEVIKITGKHGEKETIFKK